MASSWRYGKRSKYSAKVSRDPENYYRLDAKKTAAENARDIFGGLCCRETRDTKRLFLLNGLATLFQQHLQQFESMPQILPTAAEISCASATSTVAPAYTIKTHLGFTTEELLYCLSASLVHTFTQVRAAALRTIRYILITGDDIKIFNEMQLPQIICRSIDIMLKNDDERVQALKLIRKMLAISPENISPVLIRCLVSLADTGVDDGDSLLRACLATLSELAVLNPLLLIYCGGVTSITRNVLDCHNPRITESLCGVLLYLLERSHTRNICGVRLDCLAAPYCDSTYRIGAVDKKKSMSSGRDARELRYTSCRLALLSILRSWSGTIEFCDPSKSSGFKAIVDALYLNQIEIRKAILELLYELLGLPQPTWTIDYSIAFQAVDPAEFQDNWLLDNGFVAAEGRSILPSLAARAPNICVQHLALQLYCFLQTGLLNALVEVVATYEASVSVAATVLLGKLLHLMHTHLPADICNTNPTLPSLIAHATKGNQMANAAITALQCYQKMLRNRPASNSLFLDSLIQEGSIIETKLFRREIRNVDLYPSKSSPSGAVQVLGQQGLVTPFSVGTLDRTRVDSVSSSDESNSQSSSVRRSSFRLKCKFLPFLENMKVNRLIKDSNVLTSIDANNWDWEIVSSVLRSNLIRKMDDGILKFLKTLIEYFKPSNNLFSHQELQPGRALPPYVMVGLNLIDWLLCSHSLESMRLLTDFFSDVAQHLLAITTSSRVHDCLFSPQHMNNTMCQQYFLYIGRMCRIQKGISILTNTAVFEHLISLVRNSDYVCYIKLIVSGLDYILDSITRKVLHNALTVSKIRSGRLYATQFLVVLLRARIPNFEVWGIPMIIQQTKDIDRSVVLAAMEVLEEACHEKYYLEEIVRLWPNLKTHGDVGRLLMVRYYSLSRGLNQSKAKVKEEIEYWKNGYNKRYVLLVEADTHASLTLHIRNEEGYYSRRNCNTRPIIVPPNILPHLYGQMVQTTQGTTSLRKFGDVPQLIEIINDGKCKEEQECLNLKSAIWAIGHVSTHANGVEYINEIGQSIYENIIRLVKKCDVYSVRATCFNVLGLIGCTTAGANILFKLGWLSVRHDRNTIWPVHQPEECTSNSFTPLRHHCGVLSADYYHGIEDQIDSSCYMGSYWNLLLNGNNSISHEAVEEGMVISNSLEAQDLNTTTDSIKTSGEEANYSVDIYCGFVKSNGNNVTVAAKSKTFPEGCQVKSLVRHQRSLSESKTSDIVPLVNENMVSGAISILSTCHQTNRTRYNSCTDSNTSGVSSSDSVTGKGGNTGELQQFPLSPIPSMSNFPTEIPLTQSSLIRRTSMMGNSYILPISSLSPTDIRGYAQFRSLRRHCRPVLSESAAELYDIVDKRDLLVLTSNRPGKSSFGDMHHKLKVRSLDRQTSLRMHFDSDELDLPMPTLIAPKFLIQNDSQGPCYSGISLPKDFHDLFSSRNVSQTYVSQNSDINFMTSKSIPTETPKYILNNNESTVGGDESSILSSLSDVSSDGKRSKMTGINHIRSSCLQCSRLRYFKRFQQNVEENLPNESSNKLLMGKPLPFENHHGYKSEPSDRFRENLNMEEIITTQHEYSNGSSIPLSELQFNLQESLQSEESLADKTTANIIYNVKRLANPGNAKQAKMALLELKQKKPVSFQNICLYSEVCRIIGHFRYRMSARRFLQELFLDLDFDTFYNEPVDILLRRNKITFEKTECEATTKNKEINVVRQKLQEDSSGYLNKMMSSSVNELVNSEQNEKLGTSSNNPNSLALFNNQASILKLKCQPPLASVHESSRENLILDANLSEFGVDIIETLPDTSQKSSQGKCKEDLRKTFLKNSLLSSRDNCELKRDLKVTCNEVVDEVEMTNETILELKETCEMGYDYVDGAKIVSRQPNVESFEPTLISAQTSQITLHAAPISSSNCSDRTPSSSQSSTSVCTVIHQPLPSQSSGERIISSSNKINSNTAGNNNKHYTRGRFYTLELDLSCTKNKFPIRDRACNNFTGNSKSTEKTGFASSAETKTTIMFNNNNNNNNNITHNNNNNSNSNNKNTSNNINTSSTYDTLSTKMLSPLLRQHSFNTDHCYRSDAEQNTTSTTDVDCHFGPHLTVTITKSLAASLVQPIGKLHCEKRLQSSKSEAILAQLPSLITVTSSNQHGNTVAVNAYTFGCTLADGRNDDESTTIVQRRPSSWLMGSNKPL